MTIREKRERKKQIIEDINFLKNKYSICNIKAARMLSSKYGLKPSTLIATSYAKD
jgi:uncharacterized coiled-coil DUF342 family protein